MCMCVKEVPHTVYYTGTSPTYCVLSGAHRAGEAGEGACNYVYGKIQTWRLFSAIKGLCY